MLKDHQFYFYIQVKSKIVANITMGYITRMQEAEKKKVTNSTYKYTSAIEWKFLKEKKKFT